MLKPLTMSLGLGFALGMTSLGVAGGHKAMPSAQGVAPSAQGPIASAQDIGCGDVCGPVAKKHCSLLDFLKPKPKCYEYEWVLKKKRVRHGLFGGHKGLGGGCGGGDLYGGAGCGETYPSAQYPSAQGGPWGSAQGGPVADYGSGQIGGSSQILTPAGQIAPAGQLVPTDAPADAPVAAPAADPAAEPPPLPRDDENKAASNNGGLLLLSPAGN